MKRTALLLLMLAAGRISGQQVLCDFDGIRQIFFSFSTGALDTMSANPSPSATDNSVYCARYVRDTTSYDFLIAYPFSKLNDVGAYASTSATSKIKLKVYSSAPVGTPVVLQLGSRTSDLYPAGVHSEYQAFTSLQNSWQELTFNFIQMGGFSSSSDIDKIAILFNPGTNTSDTVYFDELSGPGLVAGMKSDASQLVRLNSSSPNPAKDKAVISFSLNAAGPVSLKLFDITGNPIRMLIDEPLQAGAHAVQVDTTTLPNGIYFYTLKKEGVSKSMKMIVSR